MFAADLAWLVSYVAQDMITYLLGLFALFALLLVVRDVLLSD